MGGKQQELGHWQRYISNRDQQSRHWLFANYQQWADIEASKLYRQLSITNMELEEFKQSAYQGVLEAIDRFEPTHDIQFKSFAVHRVRGAILTSLPKLSESSAYYAQRGRFLDTDRQPTADIDLSPSTEPLGWLINLVVDLAVDFLLQDSETGVSQLTGDFYSSPEINTMSHRMRDNVATLDEPMRSIIQLYYFEDLSYGKIAQLIELSNGRISQLHKKALELLKKQAGW